MKNHDPIIDTVMEYILTGQYDAALGALWRLTRETEVMSMDEVNASIRDSIRQIAYTPSRHETIDQRTERLERDRLRKQAYRNEKKQQLPPMRPINPSKKIRAIDIPCSRCGAKRGAPCTGFTSPVGGEPTGKPIQTYHQARHETAKKKNEIRELSGVHTLGGNQRAIPQAAFEPKVDEDATA